MGMNMITKSFSHPFLFLFTVVVLLLHPLSNADNTSLVFKGCAEQKLQDPSGKYTKNLKSLLVSLVAQSGQKPFYTTTSGEDKKMIMGLYQCRGDLSNSSCYNCVSKITDMLDKLCGKVVAARVQLSGCYLRYEVVGFKQVPETHLLYKVCGPTQGSDDNDGVDGFEERREMAFNMIENGVKNGGKLFYTGSYKSLWVLGQCEGDLASDDCGDCVKSAEDQAKAECGYSLSAEIYLSKCYINYSFYPKPNNSPSPGTMVQQHTQKTVALVVGGFAALGFLAVCVIFFKSVLKKNDDMY